MLTFIAGRLFRSISLLFITPLHFDAILRLLPLPPGHYAINAAMLPR